MTAGAAVEAVSSLFDWVVRVSWQASLVALVVLLVQAVLGGRVSARWRYNLWLLVVARLMLPAVPGSRWSPFNLLPREGASAVAGPAIEPAREASIAGRAALLPSDGGSAGPIGADRGERAAWIASSPMPVAPERASVPATPDIVIHVRHSDLVAAPAAVSAAPDGAAGRHAPSFAHESAASAAVAAAPRAPDRWRLADFPWRAALITAWLGGVAFCLARLLWATLALARVVRCAVTVDDPAHLDLVRRCAAELRVARPPALLVGPDGFGPALVGWLRPRLVLPAAVLNDFGREELRMVLLHELAHLRRRDVALNWVLAVIGAVHWFNPVVWLALGRMRADRELACDEMALGVAGRDARAAYGPALLKLLESFAVGGTRAGAGRCRPVLVAGGDGGAGFEGVPVQEDRDDRPI